LSWDSFPDISPSGAVDFFGLPISGHQSYLLWAPGGCTGESVIVLAGRRQNQPAIEKRALHLRPIYWISAIGCTRSNP
jgi:hypothetical protein